jgi:hypothetical protein
MDMNEFYKLGQEAALEKLGQGGLLRSIGTAAKGTWEGMTPAAQGIAKRLGAGAGIGAAGGALAGGEEHRGTGALLGGGLGALGMAGLGRHLQGKATKQLAADLWHGAGKRQVGHNLVPVQGERLLSRLEGLKPVYQQGEAHLQRKMLPGVW